MKPDGGRMRRKLHDDAGFSIAEVLIAAFVMLIALAGLAEGLGASFRSETHSERRIYASQLAVQAVEEIQARNWDLIGFWSSDPGFVANASIPQGNGNPPASLPTVTFATTALPTAGRPVPLKTASWKGVTFSIRTDIVWEDPSLPVNERSRKHLRAVVTWTDPQGGTRTVTAASLRAWPPVQRGPSLFYIVTAGAGVSAQLIDEYGFPVVPVVVDAVTNRPATPVTVSYTHRTLGATNVNMIDQGTGTPLTVWQKVLTAPVPPVVPAVPPSAATPTPPGSPSPDHRFANGTQFLTITAQAAGYPSDARSIAVTFLHDTVYVVPGSATANTAFCRKSNGNLKNAVTVSFDVQGFQASDAPTVNWTSTNGLSTSSGTGSGSHVSLNARGSRRSFTIAQNTPMPGLTVTFTIVTNRTSLLPVTGLVNLPVVFNVTADNPPVTSC